MSFLGKKNFIAKIAVSDVVYGVDLLYSYIIPEKFKKISNGQIVAVPFGKSVKKRIGVVFKLESLNKNNLNHPLKAINDVLVTDFVISEDVLSLAQFIKDRCFCTLFSAIKAMVPLLSQVGNSQRLYKINEKNEKSLTDINTLDENTRLILKYLNNKKKGVTFTTLKKHFPGSIENKLNFLAEKKLIEKCWYRKEKHTSLNGEIFEIADDTNKFFSKKLTTLQLKVLNLLVKKKRVSAKEILYLTGARTNTILSLVNKGLIQYSKKRNNHPGDFPLLFEEKGIVLNEEQAQVFDSLCALYKKKEFNTALLFGITGSGKTAIYMKLIDLAVREGKGVIVLLPEIALTSQIIGEFYLRYGTKVASYHSALRPEEKVEKYRKVQSGKFTIVVGTRSAVFLPVKNLSLIVIDEEHEDSYKSENSPKYNTKEIAKYKCYSNNCLLLLLSATPSIESYYLAKQGKYHLLTLKNRYGKAKIPDVKIVDMSKELAKGNITYFSTYLLDRLKENVKNGRQSIMLINRRGYSTFLICRNCQNVILCPRCSVSLVYHSVNNKFICHRCGYSVSNLKTCPVCNSKEIKFSGMGTQKVEEDLLKLIPESSILRMDSDVNFTKESYEKKLTDFKEKKYNIMIGTQMVAKGLNFPDVALVAILCADQSLNTSDYKSFERSFSLFTQVVGRAGRSNNCGRAVIQTFNPENLIIKLAAKQNYEEFFENEIKLRKTLMYPPFVNLCVIVFKGKIESKVKEVSECFFVFLKSLSRTEYAELPLQVLRPASAEILKLNNNYRYKIVIKYKKIKLFRVFLENALIVFQKEANTSGVTILPDINPTTVI